MLPTSLPSEWLDHTAFSRELVSCHGHVEQKLQCW